MTITIMLISVTAADWKQLSEFDGFLCRPAPYPLTSLAVYQRGEEKEKGSIYRHVN